MVAYAALIASCDSPFAPDVQEVSRLDVTPPVLTLTVGGNAALLVRVYGATDNLLPTARVFWSTQDPSVVTISQDGIANAIGAGTTQIAASSGGQSRTIAVTVAQRPIALVRISPPAGTVVAGGTLTLQGEALDGTGAPLPNRALEWTSSAPTIATVNATGVVTGVAVGQATISATGEGKTGTSIVTVLPTPVASITIEPNGGNLPAGGTMVLTATTRNAAGQPLAGRPVEWRSSNDAVATVSAAGLLTALSPGVVQITATSPGSGPDGTTPSASVTVTVLIESVASAVIVPSPIGVQIGQTAALTVNLFDGAGEPVSPAGRTITWGTSNASVATVSSSGVITGVGVGVASVTVTVTTPGQVGAVQASVQVNVSNQPVASVVVTPSPSAIVHVGYARQFTAVALDANGQPLPGRAIIWTSANQGVATVEAGSGIVSGVNQGTVQIRATSEGIQGVTSVTIDLVQVNAVTVAPPAATIVVNQSVQLQATPRDSAGVVIQGSALGGRTTNWSSTNAAAATVNATGLVTAVAQGTTNAVATIGGAVGQSAITVSPLPSASQLALTVAPTATPQNNIAFPAQPVVQLKDATGTDVLTAGVAVTVAIASGGGTLGGALTATTNATGTATFSGLTITGTIGPRTLTFTSGALTPANANVTLQPGAATQVLITTQPPGTAVSGQVFSSSTVVQLRDVSGNNATQVGVPVNATVNPGAGVSLAGGSAATNASGAATFSALTLTGSTGTYTLTFSSGALTPATSGNITLGAGSGSNLSLTVQPSPTVQNAVAFPAQPVVQLRDGSNNPVAQAGVVVSVAILSGGGALGGTTTATTNASGQATFSGLSITGTVGVRTLLFGASGFTTVTSNNVNVTPGVATALVITVQPSSTAQSGAPLGTQPAVQLRDVSGNNVTQAGVNVVATLNGAGASLSGSTTDATDAAGLASFSGLTISGTVGTYSLTFSSGSLTAATSGSITLSAGAAAQLTITTAPSGAASGSAFTGQPAIQVRDAQGNPVNQAGLAITVAIFTGGPGTLVGSGSATTNGSGLATFSGLGLSGTAGNYTLRFSSGALTPATTGTIVLGHGAAAQLTITTQPAGAASGSAFTTQPVITVRDAQGNPVTIAGRTIAASPSGGALVGSANAVTNASGVAAYAGLGLSGLVGNYTLTFASAGVPNVGSANIPLAAGAATQLTITTQPSATVASGSALATPPSVQLRDGAGNAVSQAGVNVAVGIGAGASLTGGTTDATDASGVATFTGLGVTGLVGNYTLTFTSGSLTPATSSTIAVTHGPASQLTVTTQPAGASSGLAFTTQPRIQVRDAQGNTVNTVLTITPSIATGGPATLIGGTATTNASGLATFAGLGLSGTVGNYTIGFASGSLTPATSANIVLGPGAPAQLVILTQPSGAASGAAFTTQPSVQVRDAQSNVVTTAGISVSASPSGGALVGSPSATTTGAGVATFSGLGLTGTVGNYTLNFSTAGAPPVTSAAIALAAGAATQLTMSAQPPASAASGTALSSAPAVQLRDGAGNAVTTAGVNVSVGLVGAGGSLSGTLVAATSAGVATFPGLVITGLVGNYSLSFASGGVSGITSSAIALTPGSAAQMTITTQPPSTSLSGSAFSTAPAVQLRDASGNAVSQSGVNINVSLNGAGGSLIGSTTAATGGTGLATFSGLGINSAAGGSYFLTFSGVGPTVNSSSINVTLPASKLAVTSQPSPNAVNGSPFGAQPTVQIQDANGTLVATPGVTITASITGGGATLNGTTALNSTNGVVTFSNLGITGTVGSYTLTFTASGLTSAVSNAINLAAGAATQLTFTTAPGSSTTNGAPLSPQPVIQLRDPQGNAVPTPASVTVSASIASGPAGATLAGASVGTDANGVATFAALAISGAPAPSAYTLLFTAAGVTGTVTSGPISVLLFSNDQATSADDFHGTKSVAAHTFELPTLTNLVIGRTRNHPRQSSAAELLMVVSNLFVGSH